MPKEREHEGSLGSWLRRRRKALDLTQTVLADRVGCAEVTIRKLEADVQRPSRGVADRLAICLELAPDERTLFLQVARGERSPARLPGIHLPSDPRPQATTQVPIVPLPIDEVPKPAPLPPGSRMPLSRNPLFVGREEELRDLARVLKTGDTAAIGQVEIAAATGLGGIGKTQLACEFVHRYGQFFAGGVFWLSFSDPADVPAEVAACGGADGMQHYPEFSTLPLDEQVKLVLAMWEHASARLLVFDNCEDEALLDRWRPKHGGCRVLLTSRRHHWDAALGVQALPLDVLARIDSLALLRTFRPELAADDADLDAVAEALGDLPLALHLAGSFLAKYRHAITPAQYRARLHTPTILDDRSLQAVGLSPTQHVQHVARTFEQSYAHLDAADPTDALAQSLLTHAAYFAPGEPLPRLLLRATLEQPDDTAEQALLVEDALTRLIDLGLLDTDAAGSLRLHRLVVAFVRVVLGDATAQAVVEATVLRIAENLNNTYDPRPLLTIQPHLRFITEAAQLRADAHTAGLCHALGVHLWLLGVYPEAQGYLEQAVAIRQRVLGREYPDTAKSLDSLGMALAVQGQYAEAQGYSTQALAIRQRMLGANHPETAKSLNNLGFIYQGHGRYAEAQRSYAQALAINERVFGLDHVGTATILNNLGTVLRTQGQYAEAQGCHEQALAIRQRVLGTDHPDTAKSLRALGEVLYARGGTAQARHYLEQALTIFEQRLGPLHPDTEQTRRTLATWASVG